MTTAYDEAFRTVHTEMTESLKRLVAHPSVDGKVSAEMMFQCVFSSLDFFARGVGVDTMPIYQSLLVLAETPYGADVIARGQAERIHAQALGKGW